MIVRPKPRPFDLPPDALVRTMECDIRGALGEIDLPPSLVAVDYLLR